MQYVKIHFLSCNFQSHDLSRPAFSVNPLPTALTCPSVCSNFFVLFCTTLLCQLLLELIFAGLWIVIITRQGLKIENSRYLMIMQLTRLSRVLTVRLVGFLELETNSDALQRYVLHHLVKFCRDRSYCCRYRNFSQFSSEM